MTFIFSFWLTILLFFTFSYLFDSGTQVRILIA
nr:MAG TPA: hypothetical protein [Caudoviricetes sp.]